jgi:hypothetical protein
VTPHLHKVFEAGHIASTTALLDHTRTIHQYLLSQVTSCADLLSSSACDKLRNLGLTELLAFLRSKDMGDMNNNELLQPKYILDDMYTFIQLLFKYFQ